MAKFQEIPKFTRAPTWGCNFDWRWLPDSYVKFVLEDGLNINPPFQRAHVWTADQKIRYVEYILKGGISGRDIYLNCPGWHSGHRDNFVLVDGKQRLDAVLGFLNNEFPIFDGDYFRDFEDHLSSEVSFVIHINDLKTYSEVLNWYIDLNRGGVVHSDEEIERVQKILRDGDPYVAPSSAEIQTQAGFDRELLKKACVELVKDAARLAEIQQSNKLAKVRKRK